MKLAGLRLRPWHGWLVAGIAGIAGIAAGAVALDDSLFGDTTPAFRLNASQSLGVPLALLATLVAAIAWAARAALRRGGLRASVRGMMVAVALLGTWLGTARWWVSYNFATVYAPGYTEGRFRQVRAGMTPGEVESILGPPLRKESTSQPWSRFENWIYSEAPPPGTIGDNYWRQWVMFEDGEAVVIIDDSYVD